MDNVVQTVIFPVSSLLGELPPDVTSLVAKLTSATPEERPDLEKEIADRLPENLRNACESYGAKSPIDKVKVNLKVGNILFDLYLLANPEPKSPLALLVWQKRAQEIAEVLDKDTFEVPALAVPFIRKALMDDEVWAKASLSAWVDLPQDQESDDSAAKRRYFTINSSGAAFFGKVLSAAAQALYSDDLLKDTK